MVFYLIDKKTGKNYCIQTNSLIPGVAFTPRKRLNVYSHVFQDDGCSHTTADAKRSHTILLVIVYHFVHQANSNTVTRSSNGMTQRYGTTVQVAMFVEPFGIKLMIGAQLADNPQRLCCKGFVEFNNIHIGKFHICFMKCVCNGRHRPHSHNGGINTALANGYNFGQRR